MALSKEIIILTKHRAQKSIKCFTIETIKILSDYTFSTFKEKATKWQDNVEIDGLTTNGVLIMHPKGQFCGGNAKCGLWRECSVGGDVFSLRESRSAQQKGQPVNYDFPLNIHYNLFPFPYI